MGNDSPGPLGRTTGERDTIKNLKAVLTTLVVLAFLVLVSVRVVHVPPVSGTWTHGEPGQWTHLRLVKEEREPGPGPRRVLGDLSGALKEALTRDSSAIPLHVAGSWDNPYLELELGGVDYYYEDDPGGVLCSLAGEVEGGGDRSILAEWFVRRRHSYRFVAVIRCPEVEPFRMVFEKVEE